MPGYAFKEVISVIVVAACFGEGVRAIGLGGHLGDLVGGSPTLLLPAAGFLTMAFAFVSGSGIAATQALFWVFAGESPADAPSLARVGSVTALGAAAGRTMSPASAVTLMCAGLTGTTPAELIKRVAIPLLAGVSAAVLLGMMMSPAATLAAAAAKHRPRGLIPDGKRSKDLTTNSRSIMNWLMDNPIAELHGPAFLVLYAVVVTLIIWHARWSLRRDDSTEGLDLLPIPSKPDPHAIAYLRGGANELTRLVVFDLLRRGFLQAAGTKQIERAPDPPPEGVLSRLDRGVLAFFAVARNRKSFFNAASWPRGSERTASPWTRRSATTSCSRLPSNRGGHGGSGSPGRF